MTKKTSETKFLEPELKAVALNYLSEKGRISRITTVASEFVIEHFSRRVDLALIEPNKFVAIEIKSEADSLARLQGQIEKYLLCFDKVIVLSVPKHVKKILSLTPENVEVWEFSNCTIKVRRRGKIQPIRDKTQLMKFMKANELKRLSNSLRKTIHSNTRSSLEFELMTAPVVTIRSTASKCVRERYNCTSSNFWNLLERRKVSPEDILTLSRFKPVREKYESMRMSSNSLWLRWEKEQLEKSLGRISLAKASHLDFGEVPDKIQQLLLL